MSSTFSPVTQNTGAARLKLTNRTDWKNLIDGDVDRIHLHRFANDNECDQLLKFVVGHPHTVQYSTAKGILRLGTSFSDARKTGVVETECSKSDILEEALSVNGVLARIFGQLTASWPLGLSTFAYKGTALHRSIARRITDGAAEAHHDHIAKEVPDDPVASGVVCQLGLNLYLEMPPQGGELEGWYRRLSPEEYDALRNTDPKLSYGIRRDAIGNPNWTVSPARGDLVIFRNCELHAIRKSHGTRTTWGFFVGYCGDTKPLLVWS